MPAARGDPPQNRTALDWVQGGGIESEAGKLQNRENSRLCAGGDAQVSINRFIDPLGPLLAEYYELAGSGWSKATADYVAAQCLDLDEIRAHAGILAVVPCEFDGRGFFAFDANGISSIVCEVLGEDAETVIDLCAWPIDRPDLFGTALDVAVVLGAANIASPATWALDGLLTVHRRPLDWLRAGCRGSVILDNQFAGHVFSQALGPILAEDPEHALLLRDMLCRPLVSPENILCTAGVEMKAAA